jgi:HlyD family secretion protein
MNRKTYVTGAVVAVILSFIVYTIILISKPEPLVLQGEVEATQVKISSKIPGRIDQIAVKKGQKIQKGDFVFSINSPEINAKLADATAARAAAEAQSRKAINGAQAEDIAAAQSTYIKAEAAAQFAEKTFARIAKLYEEGVVPEQQRDEVETKMKAARQTANAAESIWEKAQKGARIEDKTSAAALVHRADAAIAEVEAYLAETSIKAISDGEVSGVNAEEGELVPTGFPVVTITNLEDIWVTFFVREDYLVHFKLGTTFKASIPGLDNQSFEFKVNYISAAGDFARWNATKTSGEFDLKSFEIEARPVKPIPNLRPGMTAVLMLQKD